MTNRNDRRRRVARGLCLVFWLGLACGPVLATGPEAIPWRTDLRRAEIEARAQDRLLWVQFTGSWCPNCVRLERESFAHPQIVGKARDQFVPVKIVSDQHEDLVERFRLTGIPATIVLTPAGEVIARHEGYVNTATFHAFLENALIRGGRSSRSAPPEVSRANTAVRARTVAAASEPPVALAGFCPVSLVEEHRLVPGHRTLGLIHDGLVYRFASERMQQAFQKQPGRFLPVNGGHCPVTQIDRGELRAGEARWSLLYRDQLFLCADEDGRARFLRNPERYARVASDDSQLRPSCPGRGGLLAQGAPEPSPTTECRRPYPIDPVPLEADRPDTEALRR